MSGEASRDERQLQLLADEALFGLSEAELRELEGDLEVAPDDSFALAAAAIALAVVPRAPLPEHLAARILAAAPQPEAVHLHPPSEIEQARLRAAPRSAPRPTAPRSVLPWLAAAASLAVAVGSLVLRPPPRVVTRVAPLPPLPTAAEARQALLREARDLVKIDFAPTQDPAARSAIGDVVWSPAQQRGFMRFRGLQPNLRTEFQYQLWIFDAARDERYPVDGGVFDIGAGEVIVPIHAALPVTTPKLFAVTIEKPGGVVVSSRQRIVVTAAPKQG
ncbi:MAG: anti-sigma factor [Polyangia bacterium]